MNQFTTILWDVDGTLLDFNYSQAYAMKKCFRTLGKPITEEMIERYSEINDSYWKRLERGEISRQELYTGRFIQFFKEYGIQGVDAEAFWQEYHESLGSVYAFQDDALTIVMALHGHVKQYVVTNGENQIQRRKLKLSGLLEVMDGVFISQEVGADKPSQEFFSKVLAQVEEQDRGRILIVGDSLSSDIQGGVKAGIVTCWYHAEGENSSWDAPKDIPAHFKPDYEIQDLHQIYQVLQIFQEG